ncbi:hypothetical protein GCM10011428_05990 [Streptomyces violaceus]
MSVTSVDKDLDHLTLTLIADFAAPSSGCGGCGPTPGSWSAGGGPPTYPATVEQHDLTPAERSRTS